MYGFSSHISIDYLITQIGISKINLLYGNVNFENKIFLTKCFCAMMRCFFSRMEVSVFRKTAKLLLLAETTKTRTGNGWRMMAAHVFKCLLFELISVRFNSLTPCLL